MKKILFLAMAGVIFMGCTKHTYVVNDNAPNGSRQVAVGYPKASEGKEVKSIRKTFKPIGDGVLDVYPNATAFRMSGDYSNNVAVTLSPEGELLYFPAPTDITADSEPVVIGEGWWLNTQGLGPNSVFTKYTFAEYASLPETPTPEQIKLSVLPGAKVTEFIELPMKIDEAVQNIEEVKAYIKTL